ncbi:MAG: S8 family serine peptidase [Phycisphaerales bacterium]
MLTSFIAVTLAVASAAGPVRPAPARPAQAATPRPMWIFLSAKPHASDDDIASHLSQRALERREKRRTLPGLVDERDAPIDEAQVALLQSLGATVRTRSRWLNAVSVVAPSSSMQAIVQLPCVRGVQPVRAGRAERPSETSTVAAYDADYGAAQPQIAQMDLLALHNRGFHGEGMIVGILDTGFHRAHEAFHSVEHPLNVIAEWDFINNDGNTDIEQSDPNGQHKHGTWILGTLASYLPGEIIGAAYGASYVLAKTEVVDTETPIEEDYYVAGLEFIEAHGADVSTSSLAYFDWYVPSDFDGTTAVTTIAVNTATSNGLVCLTAQGNAGHDADPATFTLGAPADAFDVISCGAVDETGAIAGFSSDGPTADGRLKPELLARGVNTASIHSTNSSGISFVSGTSLSTPILAGAVTCVLQARPDFNVASLRGALFATATDFVANGTTDPLFVRGYGVVQADAAASTGRASGDLNLDGVVDSTDLAILLGAWGPCINCSACPNDLNGDCAIDAADLSVLLGAWG